MNKTIDQLISDTGIAIANGIKQPIVASLLLEYGYTPERLAMGEALHKRVSALYLQQKKEDGEKQASTKELQQAFEAVRKVYIPQITVARIVFRDDAGLKVQLNLNGRRKKIRSEWVTQVKVFYTNLLRNAAAMAQMADYGQTLEKLEAGHQLTLELEKQMALHKKEMGEAQEATKKRDLAIKELKAWYADYIKIARLALADQPEYLEMLGIVHRS